MLGFLQLTSARSHRFTHVSTHRSRVRFRALAASRQSLKVARATVRFDVLEAANVGADLTAQFTLHSKFLDCFAKRGLLFVGKFLCALANINAKRSECRDRTWAADTIKAGERNLKALFIWNGYTGNTHVRNS